MAVDSTPLGNDRRRSPDRRSQPDRVCIVCLEGVYAVRHESDYRPPDGPKSLWHIEACTKCGHVQFFRRDWRKSDE
jgi:hypothetical protein